MPLHVQWFLECTVFGRFSNKYREVPVIGVRGSNLESEVEVARRGTFLEPGLEGDGSHMG